MGVVERRQFLEQNGGLRRVRFPAVGGKSRHWIGRCSSPNPTSLVTNGGVTRCLEGAVPEESWALSIFGEARRTKSFCVFYHAEGAIGWGVRNVLRSRYVGERCDSRRGFDRSATDRLPRYPQKRPAWKLWTFDNHARVWAHKFPMCGREIYVPSTEFETSSKDLLQILGWKARLEKAFYIESVEEAEICPRR